jgi:hypothetical protein
MRHRSMPRTASGLEASLPQGAMGADGYFSGAGGPPPPAAAPAGLLDVQLGERLSAAPAHGANPIVTQLKPALLRLPSTLLPDHASPAPALSRAARPPPCRESSILRPDSHERHGGGVHII